MRINSRITPENRKRLSNLITAVNCQRASMGLEEVKQSDVVNAIIERVSEMTAVNLCGVFLLKATRKECESIGVRYDEG